MTKALSRAGFEPALPEVYKPTSYHNDRDLVTRFLTALREYIRGGALCFKSQALPSAPTSHSKV